MRRIVLDTNAYSAYRVGDSRVLDALAGAEEVFMPLFVLGELYFGFKGGVREQENRMDLRKFLTKPTVSLHRPTEDTAELFGNVKDQLKRKGRPIPINDVWIAASCLELGSVLVTFDNHFREIGGLRIWDHLSSSDI
jgi:tRNA(fMet)-specific endonuclease VapC